MNNQCLLLRDRSLFMAGVGPMRKMLGKKKFGYVQGWVGKY